MSYFYQTELLVILAFFEFILFYIISWELLRKNLFILVSCHCHEFHFVEHESGHTGLLGFAIHISELVTAEFAAHKVFAGIVTAIISSIITGFTVDEIAVSVIIVEVVVVVVVVDVISIKIIIVCDVVVLDQVNAGNVFLHRVENGLWETLISL